MKRGTLILKDELVRRCYACGKPKKLKEFHKSSSKSLGHAYQCKKCDSGLHKRLYLKSRKNIMDRTKIYYQENRKRMLQTYKKYNENHRVQLRCSTKKYNSSDKGRAALKRFLQTPKGRALSIEHAHKRQARLASCEVNDLTSNQILLLFARTEFCAICGKSFGRFRKRTLDHVVPVSKRGNNTKANAQVLCKSCNSKKGARLITNQQLRAELALV